MTSSQIIACLNPDTNFQINLVRAIFIFLISHEGTLLKNDISTMIDYFEYFSDDKIVKI